MYLCICNIVLYVDPANLTASINGANILLTLTLPPRIWGINASGVNLPSKSSVSVNFLYLVLFKKECQSLTFTKSIYMYRAYAHLDVALTPCNPCNHIIAHSKQK